jgi:hypothetical protein
MESVTINAKKVNRVFCYCNNFKNEIQCTYTLGRGINKQFNLKKDVTQQTKSHNGDEESKKLAGKSLQHDR